MRTELYTVKQAGIAEAAARFGMAGASKLKDAANFLFRSHPIPNGAYGKGFINGAKRFGHGAADFAREAVFGSPIDIANELKNKSFGQFYRDSATSGGRLGMGLQAAMIGSSLYDAGQAPEGHKGEAFGRVVGNAAISPITSRLGIPGQLLLHKPVTSFAGRIGRLFDSKQPTMPVDQ